jgi:hypothetical protein
VGLGDVGEDPAEKVVEPLADAAFIDRDLAHLEALAGAGWGALWRPRLRRFVTSCFH